jgi:hypothetical protein
MNGPDRAWVATRKGLFEWRCRGGRWAIDRVGFLGDPVTQVLPPGRPGEAMLAALNLGHFGTKLHASDDAGASWREVAAPAYPPQPDGAPGPAWKLVQVWVLEAGPPGPGSASRTVWAGTLPGGLFRSDDQGDSWSLIESLWHRPERARWFGGGYDVPGIHSILAGGPGDGDELLLGVSCGGVWHSGDRGNQWTLRTTGLHADYMPPGQAGDGAIQDPHRLARCAAVPEVIWCQHHNGIWRSSDNALSWQAITAPLSGFGFAVAAHPVEPDTAWFVPAVADQNRVPVGAALAVNRTRDGGKTFDTLREGLPQHHCYDLVYRHGLEVGGDGRTLMIGSTTGSLWASADGGDHWQTLSTQLPPIYAVRFG